MAHPRESMWPFRLVLMVLALGLPALPAAAQSAAEDPSERVVFWPLKAEGVGAEQAERLSGNLRNQLDGILGAQLAPGTNPQAAEVASLVRCLDQVRCAAALGAKLQARRVLAGSVRPAGDAVAVELRLVDAREQREVGRVYAVLPAREAEQATALKEMAVRLVAPQHYQGTLVLNAVDSGADVRVDNESLVIDRAYSSVRVALPVGKHAVEVRLGTKPVLTEVVDVRFEEIVVLTVPAANTGPAVPKSTVVPAQDSWAGEVVKKEDPLRLPLWISPIPLAALLPAAVATLLALVDLGYVGPLATPTTCEPTLSSQANGPPHPNAKATPLNACGSLWAYGSRKQTQMAPWVALDMVVVGGSGLLALGAVATSVVLLGVALFPATTEDDDAGKANKPTVTRKQAVSPR